MFRLLTSLQSRAPCRLVSSRRAFFATHVSPTGSPGALPFVLPGFPISSGRSCRRINPSHTHGHRAEDESGVLLAGQNQLLCALSVSFKADLHLVILDEPKHV